MCGNFTFAVIKTKKNWKCFLWLSNTYLTCICSEFFTALAEVTTVCTTLNKMKLFIYNRDDKKKLDQFSYLGNRARYVNRPRWTNRPRETVLDMEISLVFWATELDTSLSSSICQPSSICRYRVRGLSLFRGEKVKMVIKLDDLSSSITYRARWPIELGDLSSSVFQEKKKKRKMEIIIGNSMICSDIWHIYHEWYFKIVIRNFTSR